jgi:hypothetical protein
MSGRFHISVPMATFWANGRSAGEVIACACVWNSFGARSSKLDNGLCRARIGTERHVAPSADLLRPPVPEDLGDGALPDFDLRTVHIDPEVDRVLRVL